MPILTPLQRSLLIEIGRSPLGQDLFLSGGTALAAFYLQHRYSLDLDFFTANPAALAQVPAVMQDIAVRLGAQVTFTRTLGTFLECFVRSPGGDRTELDFAQDNPYRLEPTRYHAELGIHIDNPTDIACNKLSALFDRAEPKDFVDVYFVAREIHPFEQLVTLTRRKHLGLDDYWLAVALARVEQVELLPRMIKPLSLPELKAFFLERAKELMDKIERPPVGTGSSSPPMAHR
jgi:predicted nucleotidyltransferase component of viral defense system